MHCGSAGASKYQYLLSLLVVCLAPGPPADMLFSSRMLKCNADQRQPRSRNQEQHEHESISALEWKPRP